MFQRSSRLLPMISLFAGALMIAGCSHKYSADDTSLDPSGAAGELLGAFPDDGTSDARMGRLFYPLAVGNRWEYRVRMRSVITTDAGPQPPVTDESTQVDEITRTQQIGDRTYFMQLESISTPPGQVGLASEFPVRESRYGLFEHDPPPPNGGAMVEAPADAPAPPSLATYVERSVPDARARVAFDRAAAQVAEKVAAIQMSLHGLRRHPRGADPGEITMLSFPLHIGARWIVRDDPRFVRAVVAHERVNLPLGLFLAWKLRGTSELFGPDDRVHFWYSNVGLVRIRFHVTGNAVDDTGNVIGTVETDSDQSLTALALERPRALADAPLP